MPYLYNNIYSNIAKILAENGETRTLTLMRLLSNETNTISVPEPLVFEITPDVEDLVINLSVSLDKKCRLVIDWGDGCIEDSDNIERIENEGEYLVALKHIYNISDHNRVKIYNITLGQNIMVNKIYFNDGCIFINKIITIGRMGVTSFDYMFVDTDFNGEIGLNWDTSKVTSMVGMFKNAVYFNKPFGQNWDTSQVTDMSYLLKGAKGFNKKFGQNWDNSKVRNMSHLLEEAEEFNQPVGQNWDTTSLLDMAYMFARASVFNQPLNWDTSNVVTMEDVFYEARKFNQPFGNKWNTHNVEDMSEMFYCARSFNQILYWDTGKVTNMERMFAEAYSFNQPFPTGKYWNTSNVTNMASMFCYSRFNHPLKWDTSKVEDMSRMFCGAENFNQSFDFPGEKYWDTSNVIDMSYMFSMTKTFNQPVRQFNLTNIVKISYMFACAKKFNQLLDWKIPDRVDMIDIVREAKEFDQNNWKIEILDTKNS